MSDDSELIEQVFHIEEMKAELDELSNGQMVMGVDEDMPPALEEQFLEHILAFERAEEITDKELLARDGVLLPAPEELSDEELPLKLIEVIHKLAEHRRFITSTNHLNDRELYAHLWHETLNELNPIFSPNDPTNIHIDLVSSGSEEEVLLWLKYYADEEIRLEWAKDFPDMEIPPHEDPPYDRDRHLPKPPPPPSPYDDPEYEAAWFLKCREPLERKLAEDDIIYGTIVDEPLSYAPDLACVWAITRPGDPGTVGWWAISGDLPTTWLPADEISDPRAFLLFVSQRWRAAADAMETGSPPAELTFGTPEDWPRIIPMLRRRIDVLEYWAGCDEAWEDEG